ncbi:thiol-disulfide oxidoreductase DCC family protein [Bacillus atrophaeus]|uniref:thiol-disulfide oxidoreductase DCC family protein n=1 Tax=Bacillus atrophaeus TaxID=1452 RepID=UPI0018F31927|nr:DUF393 domain-containing protein [Bacillus atrophaeus]MBJ7895809.1 DUF393 domain-containing protein [Bacillus atrophaeus]
MEQNLVFYDAQCPLCRSLKAVLKKLDWAQRLRWFPVQEIDQSTYEKALKYKDVYDEIHMLTANNVMLKGFYTVRKILSVLPLTAPLGWLLYLPFADKLGKPLYQFISRHRYQWFGRLPYNPSA